MKHTSYYCNVKAELIIRRIFCSCEVICLVFIRASHCIRMCWSSLYPSVYLEV